MQFDLDWNQASEWLLIAWFQSISDNTFNQDGERQYTHSTSMDNCNTCPVAVSESFWNNSALISSRSRQKGLQYALEGYIHNLKIKKEVNITVIEADSYRSQVKSEKPHNLVLTYNQERLLDQSCSCTAG